MADQVGRRRDRPRRGSPTACAPSASRASRSTSRTASSPRRERSFIIADTPGPRPLHAQHGHRRVDRRPRRRAGRRPQRRARAVTPPRLPVGPARDPPHGRVREQDGPRRLGRGPVPRDRAPTSRRCWRELGVPTTRWRSRCRRCTATTSSSRPSRRPWYDGPTLLRHLEQIEVARDRNLDDLAPARPVGVRTDDYRGYAGRVAGGLLRPGDEVVVLPQRRAHHVDRIETFDGPWRSAFPPMSVVVHLADDLDVGPRQRDLRAPPTRRPVARRARRAVCWMADTPLQAGGRYLLKHTTRRVRARVSRSTRAWTSRRCATAARRPDSSSTTSRACT